MTFADRHLNVAPQKNYLQSGIKRHPSARFLFGSESRSEGFHAPCDGNELEGRLRQEHASPRTLRHGSRKRATRRRSPTTTLSARSLDWLSLRPEDLPAITGVSAYDEGLRGVPRDTEVLVIDAPARTHGSEMNELVRRAETILVPVLPSPIDMKACQHFMKELLDLGQVQREQARLAVVANRVRENTLLFEELDAYLGKLKVPYLASLRQSTNYLRAFQRGMGVFELPEYLAWPDWEQWDAGHEVAGKQAESAELRRGRRFWLAGSAVRAAGQKANPAVGSHSLMSARPLLQHSFWPAPRARTQWPSSSQAGPDPLVDIGVPQPHAEMFEHPLDC